MERVLWDFERVWRRQNEVSYCRRRVDMVGVLLKLGYQIGKKMGTEVGSRRDGGVREGFEGDMRDSTGI